MTLLTNIKLGRKIKRIKLSGGALCESDTQNAQQDLCDQMMLNALALEKARRMLYRKTIV